MEGDSTGHSRGDTLVVRGRSTQKYSGSDSHPRRKSRSKSKTKKQVQCFYCKKMDHVKADCFKLKNKSERESKNAANIAESAEISGDDYVLAVSNDEGVDPWIFDSGATFHISSKRDCFSSFRDCSVTVLLGDDYALNIQGISSIHLKLTNGSLF